MNGGALSRLPARAALGLIRGYRLFVSPSLAPSCRYVPSCSAYAGEAIERFGLARGGWLALRRLLRCHPWHRGGVDPVPDRARTGRRVRQQHDPSDVPVASVRPTGVGSPSATELSR